METLKENVLNQEACYEKAGGRANVGSNYFSSFQEEYFPARPGRE